MVLCSQLGCAEGAWMYRCCGVCFSEQCPGLGQTWFAHRHRASAARAGVSPKVHHKPATSTETLALLCLPCHPALSCMLFCPSAFPISPSSPQTLPSITRGTPDLFLDCLTLCTGSSLLKDIPQNCFPATQGQQQEEHRDRLAHQVAPRQGSQLGQATGSTAEGLLP